MPVLTIYGIPESLRGTTALSALVLTDLPAAVAMVEGLKLTAHQVSTFVPRDMVSSGLGEEIICFVDPLYGRPVTVVRFEVREELALRVGEVLRSFTLQWVPACTLIEVFVRTYNPDLEGAWQWTKP